MSDDAAVYQISREQAIIHTLDFFTPIVDDPYDFGAIAAANAVSDVYAMGGDVLLALNIAAFPSEFPLDIIKDILRGGAEKIKEAGGILAGGHTIEDKEPKYGLSVIGTINPKSIMSKSGARHGDILILTKPIGTGIITTAAKADCADDTHLIKAVESMKKLNRTAAELFKESGVKAYTDVTGFSILGHSIEIAEKSKVQIRLKIDKIPFLEGAESYAKEWLFPAGSCNNEKCYKRHITFSNIPDEIKMLLFTPETSGGLIAAVPEKNIEKLLSLFKEKNEFYSIVGKVYKGEGISIS